MTALRTMAKAGEYVKRKRRGKSLIDEGFVKASERQRRVAKRVAGGTLFLRLGGKLERIALATAGFRSARGLGLGDVPGVDGDHAYPASMSGHHHPIGLILAHAEFPLEHGDDELARGVVVVEQNDLVQARPFRLEADLGARLGGDVGHWRAGPPDLGAWQYHRALP